MNYVKLVPINQYVTPVARYKIAVGGEEQPYIKSGETTFSMEEEVESLVPPSNNYLY